MYDVDGNGVIDQDEMAKIVQAIFDMLGSGKSKPQDTAEERAKSIFSRWVPRGLALVDCCTYSYIFISVHSEWMKIMTGH